jgi:major vault protein
MSRASDDNRVIRLRPYYYIHVLDNNSNTTSVHCGPKTFVRKDHEEVVLKSTAMINIPPRSYCAIANPHLRDDKGKPIEDAHGQVKLRHGETEVRVATDWTSPFPLYPGESLHEAVTLLRVVQPNTALFIQANRDFVDKEGTQRRAGDQWLFHGPGTYIPSVECEIVEVVVAQVIKPNQALKLNAIRKLTDQHGHERMPGEQWLVKKQGSYLPGVLEQVVGLVRARVLTEKRALHLRASHTFTDVYGKERKAGSEWLVTHRLCQTHIPDVHEQVVGDVAITTLTMQQYCVVLNPVDENGNPRWGERELRFGDNPDHQTFFLQPGEKLENGIQEVELLGEEEALLLRAVEAFTDEEKVERKPGQEWMIYGPRKYVPSIHVQILERRSKIPLDENEGIYVRDKQTGRVYTVTGQTYMLKPNEQLWEKVLPPIVDELLTQVGYRGLGMKASGKPEARVKHKVVTYRVPHNAAVQLYDYKKKASRVVFGPELVMLEPDEQFSIMSLSGGEPKRANAITSLALMLGPDFMNDTVVVETSDHARLTLKLSYNWWFDVNKENPAEAASVFNVRDFVGDTCKAIASRVRGAVASQTFDDFHRNSALIIKVAVFGKDKTTGEPNNNLKFAANNLVVTNVDVQSVEPVEQRTRDALQKSVQLAIEISTSSQEALANHEALREEQVAEGKLNCQRIRDQAQAEVERKELVELKAKTAAAESTGQAKAEAVARAEAAFIKGTAAKKQAELRAQASQIRVKAQVEQMKMRQKQELEHKKAVDDLEIERAEKEAKIEAEKFANIVEAIGADTIEAIAQAGPEMQAKLLEGLGLQGFLVTDGTSPINLFNTANGLVGTGAAPQ